jgi:hypothetical protein
VFVDVSSNKVAGDRHRKTGREWHAYAGESSFSGALEAELSRLLVNVSPAGTPSPFLFGPGQGDIGTHLAGLLTVRRLAVSGGVPPYRFYLGPEAGGPAVPSWLKLAADGTLSIEPPAAGSSMNFTVEVVDSNGEHAIVVD